jgi:PAS domain S-box-containing protein
MIKEQILAGAKPIGSQPTRDRGLFKMLGDALKERAPVRLHANAPSHLAQVIETSPDFVITVDEAGHLLYCNPTTRRTLGLGRGDLSRIHLSELYPAWACTHILGEGIFSAILDGVWSGETALLTRGGREIPVSQVIIAPLAADGRCEFLSIIARDISESKEAEKARQEIATFYRRIVEAANIGIWIIDPENRTRFVNPRMAKLLNCPADEIVGKPIASFMDQEELALAQARREAMRRDDMESQDYKLRRSDGAELWVRLSTSSLFDEQEQFLGTLALVAESTGFKRVSESVGRFAIGALA